VIARRWSSYSLIVLLLLIVLAAPVAVSAQGTPVAEAETSVVSPETPEPQETPVPTAETPAQQETPAATDESPAPATGDEVTLDPDEDGLIDAEELEIGTDPTRFDTDGDGLGDGAEVRADGWGTDPLKADTDGDGLVDGDDLFVHSTDPKLADSDGDGANDGAEVEAGTNPNDPASRPGGGDDELGTVTAFTYLCPVGYAGKEKFDVCEPLPDVGLSIGLVASEFFASARTDTAGTARFADLGEGTFVLALDVPGDFADFEASCGVEREFELSPLAGSAENRIEFPLGPGDDVRCAWFVIPVDARGEPTPAPGGGDAAILVEKALCPVEYAGSNFANDCDPLPGIAFSLGLPGSEFFAGDTTDANGGAAFTDLDGGIYLLAEGIPGDFNRIEVFCATPGDTEPRPIRSNGFNQIEVEILSNEQLTCRWYNIPADARGEPSPTAAPTAPAEPTPGIAPPSRPAPPATGGKTPVKALPNTGAGAVAASDALVAALVLLALAGGAAGIATGLRQRRS
jgi:hypothetical protein